MSPIDDEWLGAATRNLGVGREYSPELKQFLNVANQASPAMAQVGLDELKKDVYFD